MKTIAKWFFPFWITFCGGIIAGYLLSGGLRGLSGWVACSLEAAVFGCWSVGIDAILLELSAIREADARRDFDEVLTRADQLLRELKSRVQS